MQKTILSTADVARLFNVTETTVKRWADEGTLRCQKTPGGHRKFVIKYVIEFAEQNSLEPTGVLEMPTDDEFAPGIRRAVLERDFNQLAHAFVEKALSPDKCNAFMYLSYLYEHRIQLWEIFDSIIRPGMKEIGERWSRGEIGISQEHRASYEVLDAVAKLQAQISTKPVNGRSVVLACVGEEQHEIGLRCISYLLDSEGWRTHYLGASMPAGAIVDAARELKPAAVCLSVTQSHEPAKLSNELGLLTSALRGEGCSVILGGRAVTDHGIDGATFDAVCSTSRNLLDYLQAQDASRCARQDHEK